MKRQQLRRFNLSTLILEAFAKYLHSCDPLCPASSILGRWLWERLTMPPDSMVDRVLRAEIKVEIADKNSSIPQMRGWALCLIPGYYFSPLSPSGRRLLHSLYEYASSYEQQKWSRWVHCVKASDFNRLLNRDF